MEPEAYETESAEFDMPKLPNGWRYTRKYRRPREGEYFMYCGEVCHSSGRQALPYPIVVRQESSQTEVMHHGV